MMQILTDMMIFKHSGFLTTLRMIMKEILVVMMMNISKEISKIIAYFYTHMFQQLVNFFLLDRLILI